MISLNLQTQDLMFKSFLTQDIVFKKNDFLVYSGNSFLDRFF